MLGRLPDCMPIDTSACTVCGKPAEAKPSYSGYGYCRTHFSSLIEKRVRKDLRARQPIDVRQRYVFKDDGSPLARLSLSFLRNIFGEHLQLRHDPYAEPGPLVIMPSCLEHDASEQFTRFLKQGSTTLSGIRPLRTVMLEDVATLLPEGNLNAEDFAHPLLLSLERNQPGSFFGVSKALGEKE